MDKSKIRQLAKDSFTNSQINEAKVRKISKLLDRPSLREYIKALKVVEKNSTITMIVPDDKIANVSEIGKKIAKIYPDKKILVKTDPQLIAGIKIINNDLVYEVSLKQILEEALEII